MKLAYKSLAQMNRDVWQWNESLPPCDVVCGVPRSGLLPAALLSQIRNVPLASLDGLLKGIIYEGGARCPSGGRRASVLLVEDSCGSGRKLMKAAYQLKESGYHVTPAALYVTEDAAKLVQQAFQIVPLPRVWQWNILHHNWSLRRACMDIDGLLCPDPTSVQNDDGDRYRHFLQGTRCLYRPTYAVKALVTSRLEKFRKETVGWLAKNQIKYDELHMAQYATREERIKAKRYALDKANVFRNDKFALFYESDRKVAAAIADFTGKPAYCVASGEMFNGSGAVQ